MHEEAARVLQQTMQQKPSDWAAMGQGVDVATSSRQVAAASSWMPLLERTYSFLRQVCEKRIPAMTCLGWSLC